MHVTQVPGADLATPAIVPWFGKPDAGGYWIDTASGLSAEIKFFYGGRQVTAWTVFESQAAPFDLALLHDMSAND